LQMVWPWTAAPHRIEQATVRDLARMHRLEPSNYHALWRWSFDRRDIFWRGLWDYGGVIGEQGDRILVDGDRMPGARWFPDASLNFAQNLLERRPADDADDAIVFWGEDKVRRRISHADMRTLALRVASALKAEGVKRGDRVAAYLPNMPETIIAMLGTAAIGAIWSSCSPDFGVQGVLDRFGQIEPTVLFTVDGYWYNGKVVPVQDKAAAIVDKLPTVKRVV